MDDWPCWLSGEPSLRRGKWSVSKACSNLKKIYYNLNFVFDTPSILQYKCTQSMKVCRWRTWRPLSNSGADAKRQQPTRYSVKSSPSFIVVHHLSVAMPRPHWPAMASHGSMHREARPRQLSALQSPALAAPSQDVCRRQGHPLPCRIMGNEMIIACSFCGSQESVDTPNAKLALRWCQNILVFNCDSVSSGESHGPCYSMRAWLLGFGITP